MRHNYFSCAGNLVRDAEVPVSRSDRAPTGKATVAVSRWNGEGALFIVVSAWGKTGDALASCHKGDLILVSGRLDMHEWEKADGTQGHALELSATEVEFFPRLVRSAEAPEASRPTVDPLDEEIPF